MTAPPITWIQGSQWLRENRKVISKNAFYMAVKNGTIPHIRIGRKVLVPSNALDLMLERQMS